MYRFAVAGLLLAITATANAGITVRMEVTDRGTIDVPGTVQLDAYDAAQYTSRMGVPTDPGEELLVHIFMTSDIDLDIRSMQVQWTTSTYPVDLMGVDVNTGNQGIDGIGNFWFDYTLLGEVPTLTTWGSFPADGLILGFAKQAGEYVDFSNTLQGSPLAPTAASSAFTANPAEFNQIPMLAGQEMHLGAMPIVTPGTRGGELMTLDFVTPTRTDVSSSTFIQHGFDNPQLIASAGGDDILGYAGGARGALGGPIVYDPASGIFSVVPEPATLALLAFGGIAALRRRKAA